MRAMAEADWTRRVPGRLGQDCSERDALIEEICNSPVLSSSRRRKSLLRFLYPLWFRGPTPGKVLAEEVFEKQLSDKNVDASAVRQGCRSLSFALDQFFETHATASRWRCSLPYATQGHGYQLVFERLPSGLRPSQLLWHAHVHSQTPIPVVSNEPLFFSFGDRLIFRFPEFNQDVKSRRRALEAIKEEHPEILDRIEKLAFAVGPDQPLLTTNPLDFTHAYCLSGEVAARELLGTWFSETEGVSIRPVVSRHVVEGGLADTSPILLGNPQINAPMDQVLDGDIGLRFRYVQRPDGIQIVLPSDAEILASEKHSFVYGSHRKPPKDVYLSDVAGRVAFGLLTRLPNPLGCGHVTIISSQRTKVVEQVARLMTDDRFLIRLWDQCCWDQDETPPETFQVLFAVPEGPSSLSSPVPEFVCADSPIWVGMAWQPDSEDDD
jgi:hypothetical protein